MGQGVGRNLQTPDWFLIIFPLNFTSNNMNIFLFTILREWLSKKWKALVLFFIPTVFAVGIVGVEVNLPKTEPIDSFIVNIERAKTHRKYLKERKEYMIANKDIIGIPEDAVERAILVEEEFDNYLLRKKYITDKNDKELKEPPRGLVEPIKDKISSMQWVNKAQAYVFGKEDFESCVSIPCTFDYEGGYGGSVMSLDSTSKVNGVDSARCDTNSTDSGCTLDKEVTADTEYYAQFFVFLPTGWSVGGSGYLSMMSFLDSGFGQPIYINFEDYGTVRITAGGDELGYTDTGIDIALNTLTCIEIRANINASTGDLDIWSSSDCDATEGSPNYDGSGSLNTGSDSIEIIEIGGYRPDIINDHYYDDVIIDTGFIGGVVAIQNVNRQSEFFFK